MKNSKVLNDLNFAKILFIIFLLSSFLLNFSCSRKDKLSPNFLLIITDDQSWEHLGCYGDKAVRTPTIDNLASEGIRFEHAYAACPSCSPSRASILTGQDSYRLKEGGVLTGFIREEYVVFPKLLEENGYSIGYTGKGYWPKTKNVKGTIEEPFGKKYDAHQYDKVPKGISKSNYAANFKQFISNQVKGTSFLFIVGTGEPHRPYDDNRGIQTGIDTSKIRLPSFIPDIPVAKLDLADYMSEIEWADKALSELLEVLESEGIKENTLIIFTSDNGMPLPRSKATLYDHGVRMPLIISWDAKIKEMKIIEDPVSLIDLAPTILEIAGIDIPEQMTGKSISDLLLTNNPGANNPEREFVVSSFEKHTHCRTDSLGYPRRAIHTKDWSYIINYESDRYPMGDPDIFVPNWDVLGDTDPSRLKEYYKQNVHNIEFTYLWNLAFGKITEEQFFNKSDDPDMVNNLAYNPDFQVKKNELRKKLENYLLETNDPRANGESPWDKYYLDK